MKKLKLSLVKIGGPYIGGVIGLLFCGTSFLMASNSMNTIIFKGLIGSSGLIAIISGMTLLKKSINEKIKK